MGNVAEVVVMENHINVIDLYVIKGGEQSNEKEMLLKNQRSRSMVYSFESDQSCVIFGLFDIESLPDVLLLSHKFRY